jgi:hypothetical protein
MEGKTVQIGVSIKDCPTAIAVESVESEDPQQSGAYASEKPLRMPFGLINFKIAVLNPGDQAVVKLYFSEPAPAKGRWYKYDSISDSWYDFSAYARFAANRRSLTLTLRDGGPGDADGVANGVIVDPAGIVEEADAETISSDVGVGGGEGGGCFIAAANAGVAAGNDICGWWLMLGLMSVTWPLICRFSACRTPSPRPPDQGNQTHQTHQLHNSHQAAGSRYRVDETAGRKARRTARISGRGAAADRGFTFGRGLGSIAAFDRR